ncbi:BspA family leucine-rich repeat surface protein [Flagellimonas onchidii]|uniref:BspA family leucine-rich repeat surface protein n=1 Tax=Flagellimonas onchidii TaxID=2562684 RepID=UPI0010A5D32E|nr:BspA family leucine-rich repeat surface protein [Allomuricauda onchidii]
MRNVKVWVLSLLLIGAVSCSKKEDPVPPTNSEPKVDQSTLIFDTNENISDTDVIGTLKATDADGDELKFSMVANSEDLFEVVKTNEGGAISLAAGKSFDIQEESKSYKITIGVSDDNNPTVNAQVTINVGKVNNPPVIEAVEEPFEVDENVEGAEIGEIVATDEDGDTLAFDIEYAETDEELFTIDEATGALSLAEGVALDFEDTPTHTITISVSDGTDTVTEEVTINVVDDGLLSDSPDSLITVWTTDAPNVEIQLNAGWGNGIEQHEFDYTVDWGDGTIEENLTDKTPSHQYAEPGTYTVAILGKFPDFRPSNSSAKYLSGMEQWGNNQWIYIDFIGVDGMEYNATDKPDLSIAVDMSWMFLNSNIIFNESIGDWDMSNIMWMNNMFEGSPSFNEDISGWDVSSAVDMKNMFKNATSFDQDLSEWDVSSVTDMTSMFQGADAFNQPLSWGEKTAMVTSMNSMFLGVDTFNQDISGWDVSSVTDMGFMFEAATSFNQSLGAWDISSIANMTGMLNNSGMSSENFGATLIGWAPAEGETIPEGIALGSLGMFLCDDDTDGQIAAIALLGQGWSFPGVGNPGPCN